MVDHIRQKYQIDVLALCGCPNWSREKPVPNPAQDLADAMCLVDWYTQTGEVAIVGCKK